MEAFWFVVVMWSYQVPPPLAFHVHQEAIKTGISPLDSATLLLAENPSRTFRACKKGSIGETGVFQIHPPSWRSDCEITSAGLCTYEGSARCAAWIIDDLQTKHRASPEPWHAIRDDLDALLDAVESTRGKRPDWRVHWRCSSEHLTSPGCSRNVKRVKALQRRLSRAWVSRGSARALWPLVGKAGALVVRSIKASRWRGGLIE
jgi:hypothetical protein